MLVLFVSFVFPWCFFGLVCFLVLSFFVRICLARERWMLWIDVFVLFVDSLCYVFYICALGSGLL